MKKLLSIILSLAMIFSVSASGLGFNEGVDDKTVLYQDLCKEYKPKKAKQRFDTMIREGADPNKTMSENGYNY